MLTHILVCSLVAAAFCETPIQINDKNLFGFREPPVPKSKSLTFNVKQEWIDQRVDNFDPQNGETYKMVGSIVVSRFVKITAELYVHRDTTETMSFSHLDHRFSFTSAANGRYRPVGFAAVTCTKWPKN